MPPDVNPNPHEGPEYTVTGKDHDSSPSTGPAQEPDGQAGPPRPGPVRRAGRGCHPDATSAS